MRSNVQPDGSVAIGFPRPGYNDHSGYLGRGTYSAAALTVCMCRWRLRTNDPDMKFVANVGADWWRDATADYVQGFANNPGAGMSNWVELSTEWSHASLLFLEYVRTSDGSAFAARRNEASACRVRHRANTSPPCVPKSKS